MKNRVAWIVAGLSLALAAVCVVVTIGALRHAEEQRQFMLLTIDTVYSIHASQVSMLVDGLTHLQEGDAEIGYQYLELLLKSRMAYLQELEEPHGESVEQALRDGETYFEKPLAKP